MSTHATGTFEVKTWDEKLYDEIDGAAKLTRASVTQSFHGDIEGEGSFVLQVSGTFEGGMSKATWFVVPGSGTGELRGLRGEGGFPPHHGRTVPITLDYDFE